MTNNTPTQPSGDASRESKMVTLRTKDSVPTVWCDPEIADLVHALNTATLSTDASCSGHGHRPGFISMVDGRWLFVATEEQRRVIDSAFPLDINGELVPQTSGDAGAGAADPLSDFQEGQWWIQELDHMAASLTSDPENHDLKRAVAVVHHMLRSARAIEAPPQVREQAAMPALNDVFKATAANGETCHFGTERGATIWAGAGGKVDRIALRNLSLVTAPPEAPAALPGVSEALAENLAEQARRAGGDPIEIWIDKDDLRTVIAALTHSTSQAAATRQRYSTCHDHPFMRPAEDGAWVAYDEQLDGPAASYPGCNDPSKCPNCFRGRVATEAECIEAQKQYEAQQAALQEHADLGQEMGEYVGLSDERIREVILQTVYEGDGTIPYREQWSTDIGIPFARAILAEAGIKEKT